MGERQFSPSYWARLLGRANAHHTSLASDRLTIVGTNGDSRSFAAIDCLGDVVRRRGLFWDSITIDTPTGPICLLGLPRSTARDWESALSQWLAPARLASLEPVRASLRAAADRSAATWAGTHFVRASDQATTVLTVGAALSTLPGSRWDAWCSEDDRVLEFGLREDLQQAGSRRFAINADVTSRAIAAFKGLFDAIERNPLTEAQRQACVMADDNNLVLAGAGTGKTSVVLGRVAYLMACARAAPQRILAVAYNVDAAKELSERLRTRIPAQLAPELVTVRTFHAFGLDVIAAVEGRKPPISRMAEDPAERATFVTRTLDGLLERPEYLHDFQEYGFNHLEPFRSLFDFPTMAAYEYDLAGRDLRALSGDRVKSLEELRIANWLTVNGVAFKYEAPYPVDTADGSHRTYQPDFTIDRPESPAGPLFLEHFGIDERGNPPPFFSAIEAKRYRDGIDWKRKLHEAHGTQLVETYSYEFRRGTVFHALAEKLKSAGVTFHPRSDAECLKTLRASHVVTQTGAFFTELLPLCREIGSTQEIAERLSRTPDQDRYRTHLLWRLVSPVLAAYERALADAGDLDFSDLLTRALGYVSSGRYRSPYTEILVDEFQDISESRARLVKALRDQVPGASLFCVGDDWQSIYRFAGADVTFTSRFVDRIGDGSTVTLDRTFRFNDQIGRVASTFVMKNPAQTRKAITSDRTVRVPAVSLVATEDLQGTLPIVLARIGAWSRERGARYTVRILARYWHELDDLHARAQVTGDTHNLEVALSTVHASKGLEADFVIVVGLGQGRNGFPARKPTDPFQEAFLPGIEPYDFAEERRLFYVALTRARHRIYLLYDRFDCSPFVRELIDDGYPIAKDELRGSAGIEHDHPRVPCPRCATGHLRLRVGDFGSFVGCDRYPLCHYRERGCDECDGQLLRIGQYRVCADPNCPGVHAACPDCGSPMRLRRGSYGSFFGCGNYGSADFELQCNGKMAERALPPARDVRQSRAP